MSRDFKGNVYVRALGRLGEPSDHMAGLTPWEGGRERGLVGGQRVLREPKSASSQ